jgi:hypothetical protein
MVTLAVKWLALRAKGLLVYARYMQYTCAKNQEKVRILGRAENKRLVMILSSA